MNLGKLSQGPWIHLSRVQELFLGVPEFGMHKPLGGPTIYNMSQWRQVHIENKVGLCSSRAISAHHQIGQRESQIC